MKRTSAMCCLMLLSAAGFATAQNAAMTDKMTHDGKPGAVMMSGCVAEGPGGHYMLNNAMMTGDMKGQSHEGMAPMSYGLMGGKLKAHVGHKVEIAGTMASDKMHGGMNKSKPTGDTHGSINVKSVKMLASSCP